MNLWVNIGLAWFSIILAFLLSIIYILRLIAKNKGKIGELFGKIHRILRKYHKWMGLLLVVTGLVHGLFSTQKVWSFNLGTLSWIISILLGINWMIRKYVGKLKSWIFYHRVLTVLFIGIVIWHIIDVGGVQVFKLISGDLAPSGTLTQIDPSTVINTDGLTLKDGTYEGEATGYRPGLMVSVEIEDNQIISIEVTEHNEQNSRFYSKPIELIPQEILDAQSTEVDAVSGATFTSVGIINAVNDALSKALLSGELPADQELPQNSGRGSHSHGNRKGFPVQ